MLGVVQRRHLQSGLHLHLRQVLPPGLLLHRHPRARALCHVRLW
jgi:hypothetical protein